MDAVNFQDISEHLMAWSGTPEMRSKIAEALELCYGKGYDAGKDSERDAMQRNFEEN